MKNLIGAASAASAHTDDTSLRRIGIGLVIAIFGGLGTWAALAPLSSAALAPGQVTVENYRKTIQHLEGGIIDQILVKDGDWVEKDQVLLTLNDAQFRSDLEVNRGYFFMYQAREARLIAQRDERPTILYPEELQHSKDPRAIEAMHVQTHNFQARHQALENEIKLYREQIGQLRAKEKGIRSQKESADLMVHSFGGELDDFKKLLHEGYTEKQTVRQLERHYAESMGQSGELQSSLSTVALQISESELKILQLKKEFQREVAKELAEVQAGLFEIREKVGVLEKKVQRSVIRAPDNGKILGLKVHTLGGVIPSGAPILEIVPQNEKLLIEARVSPLDIDRVQVGQAAEVRFSVFKSKDVPKLEGHLVGLSADSLVSEDAQHTPYYQARVEVDPASLDTLARLQLELLPGMPAEVLINTGKRTLFQYLADPLKDSFARSFIED